MRTVGPWIHISQKWFKLGPMTHQLDSQKGGYTISDEMAKQLHDFLRASPVRYEPKLTTSQRVKWWVRRALGMKRPGYAMPVEIVTTIHTALNEWSPLTGKDAPPR